jgi:hypothetical protein
MYARLVRHGHLREREVMTGIGPVKVPRVRDQTSVKRKSVHLIHLPPLFTQGLDRIAAVALPQSFHRRDFQEALAHGAILPDPVQRGCPRPPYPSSRRTGGIMS